MSKIKKEISVIAVPIINDEKNMKKKMLKWFLPMLSKITFSS